MGLLDAFKQYINDAMPGGLLNPESAQLPGLLNTQANATAQAIKAKGQSFKRGLDDPQKYAGEAFTAGMDMAGMAPLGLTVWHGSPHKFSKFDMSKIGTGEGAQAYGYGLYMAESPAVAKSYADELGNLEILHNNKVVGVFDKDPAANAAHQIRATGGDIDKAIKRAQNIYTGSWRDSVVNEIKKLGPGEVSERVNGSMYKVDIPDEAVARMLDWDAPLSQQAPEVQAIFDTLPKSITGKDAYAILASKLKPGVDYSSKLFGGGGFNKASEFLKQNGITGVRYLDGGSRASGQGSSNYVLFDDKMPRILEINGQATGQVPWAPNEWRGLLGGQ